MTAAPLSGFQASLDLERIHVKGGLPADAGGDLRHTLRILTWNIERGHDPARICGLLEQLRPDVACLQEVDWGNARTGGADVLQVLAERTGSLGLYGIEFLELDTPARPVRLAGGGAIGNALLTRFPPVAGFRIELPAPLAWATDADNRELPRSVRWHVRREPRIGKRCGIGAELAVGAHRVVVCSLHLEDKWGGIRGRWAQFAAAVAALEARPGGATARIIAGDFNTFDSPLARLLRPGGAAAALGKPPLLTEAAWWQSELLPGTGYVDPFPPAAWTFQLTPFFRAKLDWIAVSGGRMRDRGIGPFASSDHRPLWLDLDLAAP